MDVEREGGVYSWMPRCPVCGTPVRSPTFSRFGSEVCHGCGAKLTVNPSDLSGNLIVLEYPPGYRVAEEQDLTEHDAEERIRNYYPSYSQESQATRALEEDHLRVVEDVIRSNESKSVSQESRLIGDKTEWGHCNHCHAVIMLSNAKFCSNCGSSLRDGSEGATPYGEEEEANARQQARADVAIGKKCMVCDLEFRSGDNIVWCPGCGNPAHRDHLFEWIHVKSRCPICGIDLHESDF